MNPVSERFQNLLVSRNNSDFNSLFPNSYANDLSFVMNALDQPNFIEVNSLCFFFFNLEN